MIQLDDEKISEEEKAKAEARPVIEVDPKEEYPLTAEDEDDIIRHADFYYVFGENDIKDEMKDWMREKDDYVSVTVPFSGGDQSWWDKGLEHACELFTEDIQVDSWDADAIDRRQLYLEELKKSQAWKEQAAMVLSSDIKDYRCGKKIFEFVIPCGYRPALDANLRAIDDALDHTLLQSVFNAHNWKISAFFPGSIECTVEYWIPSGIFPLLAIKEVFRCKWFRKYVEWNMKEHSKWYAKEERKKYRSPKHPEYYDALLRFWIAMGLYAKKNFIRPVYPREFNTIEDPEIFSEEQGLGWEIANNLEMNAMENYSPDGDFTKAYV